MKNNFLYLFLILLFPVFSFAQEITGIWKGELYVDSTQKYYPFELSISKNKEKFSGYSRITFEENGIKQVVFRDHTIIIKDNLIIVEDDNQLSKASSISQPKEVKKTMLLSLVKQDSTMQLKGSWSTNKTKRFLSASGTVDMQQKRDFRSTDIFKKLNELALTDKLSFNTKQVLVKEEPSITLEKIILSGLTKLPISKKKITFPANIKKPGLFIRPGELPIAKIEKTAAEPVPQKPVAVTEPVKKPIAAVVVKAKEVAVAKSVNPVVPKIENSVKPTAPENKPVVIRNNPLPVLKNAAVDVASRTISSIQSLYYKSDSLQLTLYDNGEIDGDTVSVLLNGKVIIAKWGLTTQPNYYTLYFDKDTPDSMMLVMYAENLGSIPPNTGLLVVREGRSVYEVRFSADLKSNAAIILRRKREE